MKHLWKVLVVIVVMLTLVIVPATVIAATPNPIEPAEGYDSVLLLENKTPSGTWPILSSDDIYGILSYNSSGETFEYNLAAIGLTDGNYSLIYYADKESRFEYWGGDNPGKVIATFTVTSGTISPDSSTSVDLGMDLPCPSDANINPSMYNYCTSDGYNNCNGAKIWLIPTSALTSGNLPVQAWPPTNNWLFETDLIWYNDTGIASSQSTTFLTVAIPAEEICVSVTPNSLNFGTMQRGDCNTTEDQNPVPLTITNCGDIPITVTALVSGNLYTGGNLDISDGYGWEEIPAWSTTLAVGASANINLKLCIPLGFPAGTATGSLSFIAAP